MSIQPDATENRQTELPVKARETLTRNHGKYTATELDFAAVEKLGRLETRYVVMTRERYESFQTPEGDAYRDAGNLYIRTGLDGVRRFTAYLSNGSVEADFKYLDDVIVDARNGRMDGWTRHTFKDGDEGWLYEYTNYQIDPTAQSKPAYVIIEEQSESDGLVGFGSTWGYPCKEPRCSENYHEHEDGSHTLDEVEKAFNARGSYQIEVQKDMLAPNSDWYLNLWFNGDCTELAPEQIASLINDLQWMSAECDAANGRGKSTRTIRRDPSVDERLREMDS